MGSITINVFLSCSSREDDADIVNLVKSICRALDVNCVNVSAGYTQSPLERAKGYIRNLPAMIAVATRREPISDEKYMMPPAVRDEISMAYALEKPVLLICEDGVQVDGLISGNSTYLPFSRESIRETECMEKLIASIYNLRKDVLPGEVTYPHTNDYYAETYSALIELDTTDDEQDEFIWYYVTTRRIRFVRNYNGVLSTGFRPDRVVQIPEGAPDIEWGITIEAESKPFEFTRTLNEVSPTLLDLSLQVIPEPETNDFIEFTVWCRSKYLFPIYYNETFLPVIIKGKKYTAWAGLIRSVPTEILKIVYKLPSGYGLEPEDITCFVSAYNLTIGFIDEKEMERVGIEIESFGGDIVVTVEVSRPKVGCFYGIAWRPPRKGAGGLAPDSGGRWEGKSTEPAG